MAFATQHGGSTKGQQARALQGAYYLQKAVLRMHTQHLNLALLQGLCKPGLLHLPVMLWRTPLTGRAHQPGATQQGHLQGKQHTQLC